MRERHSQKQVWLTAKGGLQLQKRLKSLLDAADQYSKTVEGALHITRTEADMNMTALAAALHQVLNWRGFVNECNHITQWKQHWLGTSEQAGMYQKDLSHKSQVREYMVRLETHAKALEETKQGLNQRLVCLREQARFLSDQQTQNRAHTVRYSRGTSDYRASRL